MDGQPAQRRPDAECVYLRRAPDQQRPTATGSPARRASPHVVVALQCAAGNQAVAAALRSGPPVVQRASRDDLLSARRKAIQADAWQEVATRLNGFNAADIVRLAAGLSVGQAANTRAAVATYPAGWPQEQSIIQALDYGRSLPPSHKARGRRRRMPRLSSGHHGRLRRPRRAGTRHRRQRDPEGADLERPRRAGGPGRFRLRGLGSRQGPGPGASALSPTKIHVFARDLCTDEVIVNRFVENRTLH